MSEPKRIQRKRMKGWRMPENAVYVGRPTKWGNPYEYHTSEEGIRFYEGWLEEQIRLNPHFLDQLKGKDLACWCPVDKPCHADVLLKFLKDVES